MYTTDRAYQGPQDHKSRMTDAKCACRTGPKDALYIYMPSWCTRVEYIYQEELRSDRSIDRTQTP